MNNIISLRRIGLLLRNEFSKNGRSYLILASALVGLYILSGVFEGPAGLQGIASSGFTMYISIVTIMLPFATYNNLFHPVKGLNAPLLPASNEEKYLTAFLQCAVAFPLGMILLAWILTLLGALLTGHNEVIWNIGNLFVDSDSASSSFSLGFFDSDFWKIIACQSFTLWAVHFFKSRKFWKAFLTWVCVSVSLLIIGSIAMVRLLKYKNMSYDFVGSTRFEHILYVFITIIVPLGLWIWGYLKMKRQQF